VGSSRRHHRPGRLAGALLRTQPDERLVALARDGSRPPFDEIVRRHRPALIAFAGTFAPPSRAEDVVQESLLKAYSALQEGAEPELLRAWLFRIVRNTAIDEQRGVRHYEELDENYDGVVQPPQALERREQVAALVVALGDLPAAQREAIVMRELEGRGHEEIGRALAVSPGAVRQLIYRARHTLRGAAGTVIPAGLVRAASMPGADETIGGLGMAGAVKVGLAAIVATGTIVAGTSIQSHDGGGSAEALQLHGPRGGAAAGATETAAEGRRAEGEQGRGEDRSGDRSRDDSGDRGPSGTSGESGSSGNSGPGGSGDDGGGNSGPGSDDSGSGSGSSDGGGISSEGPGGGGEIDTSGSGSSGEGSSGDGFGTSSGSGSDGGGTLLGTTDSSSDGPG
jgi:RNA polymerase sigma factor (sigma-70 family)